ncbi:MAG: FlgD immunoglobulin-like domain containing protein [Calditrichia bacterium]
MRQFLRMVWIFLVPGMLFAQLAENKIVTSDATNSDEFGITLAVDGDIAVVGAHRDRPSGSYSGSAYILTRSAGGWTEQQKLLASDTDSYKRFGNAVDISGSHIVVGAMGDDHSGPATGSAYIFRNEGGSWQEQTKLLESSAERDDEFATAVSIDGEYVLIGVPGDDDETGSAYIYTGSGANWNEQQILTDGNGQQDDKFGYAVALQGNLAVIGSPGDKSVFVFERSGSSWSQLQRISPAGVVGSDEFGEAVAISGDYIVVGAASDSESASEAGAVYVFKRGGNSWSQTAKIRPADAAAEDNFGISVSIENDVLAVGARYNDESVADGGAAYIFTRAGENWTEINKVMASDAGEDDRFGNSIDIQGDVLLVGAYKDDQPGSQDTGSVYAFSGFGTTGIGDEDLSGIATFRLDQNYPNPFNPSTQITYQVATASEVRLTVYNLLGQSVRTLVNGSSAAGSYSVSWNGVNDLGFKVPSGVYLYRLEAGEFVETRRMIYLQ